mgnify:CR=1 FL=1
MAGMRSAPGAETMAAGGGATAAEAATRKVSGALATAITVGPVMSTGRVGATAASGLTSTTLPVSGRGNFDVTLPPLGSDELGALAKQFNAMTASLKRAGEEAKEQAIFNDQVKQAQEIQEGMNPSRFLKKPEYQIKGFTRAAKGVGGDYYDFQVMGDGRIAVLISDVSGKSISASLVMVLIKTVVSTYLKLFNTIRGDRYRQFFGNRKRKDQGSG